jgi:hypothetical protein
LFTPNISKAAGITSRRRKQSRPKPPRSKGLQQINLDNQRFIGDASWRQNMQTFEAVGARVTPVKDLNLYYSYVWDVNRVYGDVSGLPAANTDFDSRSHLINVSYAACPYGRLVGYAYLLDLSNSAPGAAKNANSCATYGGYFAGDAPINDKVMIDYRAEFAWQDQYADNPQRYSADYYNFELGANIKPVAIGTGSARHRPDGGRGVPARGRNGRRQHQPRHRPARAAGGTRRRQPARRRNARRGTGQSISRTAQSASSSADAPANGARMASKPPGWSPTTARWA